MSIASGLAAARQHIRNTVAAISPTLGYLVTIRSAAGRQDENPLKTPDSALPKAWVLSTQWMIRKVGGTWGSGSVTTDVNLDVWFINGRTPGAAEDYEEILDAVVMALGASTAPAGTRITFADQPSTPELTADGRAILRIPMTIEAAYSLR